MTISEEDKSSHVISLFRFRMRSLRMPRASQGSSQADLENGYSDHLNRPTLKGKCFTPKDGKWKSLSKTSEVKRWRATIFA